MQKHQVNALKLTFFKGCTNLLYSKLVAKSAAKNYRDIYKNAKDLISS